MSLFHSTDIEVSIYEYYHKNPPEAFVLITWIDTYEIGSYQSGSPNKFFSSNHRSFNQMF